MYREKASTKPTTRREVMGRTWGRRGKEEERGEVEGGRVSGAGADKVCWIRKLEAGKKRRSREYIDDGLRVVGRRVRGCVVIRGHEKKKSDSVGHGSGDSG